MVLLLFGPTVRCPPVPCKCRVHLEAVG